MTSMDNSRMSTKYFKGRLATLIGMYFTNFYKANSFCNF